MSQLFCYWGCTHTEVIRVNSPLSRNSFLFSDKTVNKMNWTKSYLLPLNFCVVSATFSGFISVVHSFKYLCIYPSLKDIVSKLNKNFAKVNSDLANWTHLPTSFHARISVVKMIILPCVNFYSSMIPLPPPAGYWKKLFSNLSIYLER